MKIDEVSLVDKPANKRRFLLIKREDGEMTDIAIKTDGTADGSEISVNGEVMEDLTAFYCSLLTDEYGEGSFSIAYTKPETDGAEFDREVTYYLKKGMNTMDLEKLLKSLDVDAESLSEEVTQDLESVLSFVDMMPPAEAKTTLRVIKRSLIKEEAPTEEGAGAEDTPAEEQELTPEGIAEVRSAMTQLNSLLPEAERVVIKAEEPDKSQQILDVLAGIMTLLKGQESEAGSEGGSEDDTDPPGSMKDILARLTKVEKTTGVDEEEPEDPEERDDPETPLTKEERIEKYGTPYPKAKLAMGLALRPNT